MNKKIKRHRLLPSATPSLAALGTAGVPQKAGVRDA